MTITVGGVLIFFGALFLAGTVLGTLFVAFATGMSDNPQEKFRWSPTIICTSFSVGLILIGKFSGL